MTLSIDLQKIIQADSDHLVHPLFHPADQKNPFIWVQGEGAVLRSADGREFIDGLSGLWNVAVGHGRKELAQAAARQMEQLAYASAYTGNTNVPAVELAEKLAKIGYRSINHFFFASGGGEANDSAIKTAWYYWHALGKLEKRKIIAREHAYHGVTIGSMSATGIPQYWPMFGGKLPGFLHIPSPYPYRFVSGSPEISPGVAAANLLERAILSEGPDTVAAFIAEPVQGAGGVIVPPEDYFGRIRQICDRYDVLFIADEVITGFGRTGRWFGLERYGVEPDMVTFAKGVTSGYFPMSGVGLSDRVIAAMQDAPASGKWMHAFTYSGHPVGSAVALANIEIIEREGLMGAAETKGNRLLEGLRQLLSMKHVGDVRGLGLLAGVELVAEKSSKQPFAAEQKVGERLARECASRGLISRFRGDTYVLAPPFVTSDEQIDRIVSIVGDSVAALEKSL